MKKLFWIPLLLVACTNQTTPQDSGPVTEIDEAVACLRVGPASEDPLIKNLIDKGYQVDYHGISNSWLINGEVVGVSQNEDEGFILCAERDLYDGIAQEREAIVASGGYGS